MTNDTDLETIAAFVDGERVDPTALKKALGRDEGRDYLVELVAMREVIAGPTAPVIPQIASVRSASWRGIAAAAVVALTVGIGGYALGHFTTARRMAAEQEAANKAPAPTREIAPTSTTTWIETSGGQH